MTRFFAQGSIRTFAFLLMHNTYTISKRWFTGSIAVFCFRMLKEGSAVMSSPHRYRTSPGKEVLISFALSTVSAIERKRKKEGQ